jgi:hypothetical protein
MTGASARGVLVTVAAAALLSACAGGGAGSAPKSQPESPRTPVPSSPTATPTHVVKPPPPPPPPLHACYRMSFGAALAPTNRNKPVPCSQSHTAVTFFVGRYPRTMPVDGKRLHRLVSTVCPRRFAAFVGGGPENRRLSLLRTIWFTPTVSQSAAGAHWFRCEAISIRDTTSLLRLKVPVAGALDRSDGRTYYGLCGNAEPGTRGFGQRACGIAHSWRALRTVPFRPGPYPGVATVRSAGRTTCQDAARSVASNPLDYKWSYQWPSLAQWRDGQTYGLCWAPG